MILEETERAMVRSSCGICCVLEQDTLSVDSAVKRVPGGDNLLKGVQCYELFRGITLKNHAFFMTLT